MKKYSALFVTSILTMAILHAGILDKKGMQDVHKVALVSLYSPKRILLAYHMPNHSEWSYKDPADDKSGEENSWMAKEQPENEIQALYDYSLKTFESSLSGVSNWQFAPFASVSSNPSYKSFKEQQDEKTKQEMAKAPQFLSSMIEKAAAGAAASQKQDREHYRVAGGMHFIPFSWVSDGVKRFGDDPFKARREALAKLARDLNVDAVAIVEVRTAFRFGKLAKLKVGDEVKGIPRIGSRMMLVSKDAKVVGDTGYVVTKLQDDFEGNSVSIAKDGKMLLDTPQARSEYQSTISASADKMKTIMSDALEKLN